jgi:hypothetical protein
MFYLLVLECITAENYIKQYNNWCDEYDRYHKALNDWEELKDKVYVFFFISLKSYDFLINNFRNV